MKKITVHELDEMIKKLGVGIKDVVEITKYNEYEDWFCIKDYDEITDPDQLQLLDEYKTVLRQLCGFHYTLQYYQRQIIGEGVLSLNSRDYFEDKFLEYHCGQIIEFYFYDDWDEKWKWRTSRIEHDGERYYIVGNPKVELNGLRVRHRKW